MVEKFQQSRKNILRRLALTVAHQSANGVKLRATVKIKRVLVVSKHQNMTISLRLETFLFVKYFPLDKKPNVPPGVIELIQKGEHLH